MSRRPDYDSVNELRHLLVAQLAAGKKIECLREEQRQLAKLEEQFAELNRKIIKLLEAVDCKASGNMGWEQRITWLLAELVRQTGEVRR
jgi:hypothetical protein